MGIGQFLLSYWWIVILLVIIIFVVAKSLIKVMTTIVILSLVFVTIWQIFIAPGFLQSTNCFTAEAEKQALIYDRAQSMNQGDERNLFICREDTASFKRLEQCFNTSRKDNSLSFSIYSKLNNYKKTMMEIVTSHNRLCPESPVAYPGS